jgi:hypothetical protein
VWRGPEEFGDEQAHENFLAVHLGLVVPVGANMDLSVSGSGFLIRTGAARELYSAQLEYQPSQWVILFGSALAEGGKPEERVDDFSILMGVRVFYGR